MARIALLVLVAGCLAGAAVGCGGSLKLHRVVATSQPPARVTVLLDASDRGGPVADLTADNFTVFEDARQLVAGREVVVARPDLRKLSHTILLIDLSQNPPADELGRLAQSVQAFAAKLPPESKLTVFGFDGSVNPHPILPMTAPRADAPLERLASFSSSDPSRDLFSAYAAAVRELDRQMATHALAVGAIVLVTRGPDLAARMKRPEIKRLVEEGERDFARITIAVGKEADEAALGMFATMDEIQVQSYATLSIALDGVAEQIDALGRSYYIVSACSAARAGSHTLKIEAKRSVTTEDGKTNNQTGTLRYTFDAGGFSGGCEPTVPKEWGGAVRSDGGASDPETPSPEPPGASDSPEPHSAPDSG